MTEDTDNATGERTFKIHAIEADIVLNRFGLHVHDGAMYVLEEHLETIRQLRDDIRAYLEDVEPVRKATGSAYDEYEERVDAVLQAVENADDSRQRRQQAAHNVIHEQYDAVLGGEQLADLDDLVHETLAQSYDIDEKRQLAVRATIDEYGPLVEVVRRRLADAVDETRGDVEKYSDRIDQLQSELEDDHETVEGLRQLVASYCEAIPKRQYAGVDVTESARRAAELNPLDDAYALLEENNQKDPSIIQPLVIRANRGEEVTIEFVNHLDRSASIHQTALPYDVKTSDGMAVGKNPDTTAAPESEAPGNHVEYTWQATRQGTHFFYDGANQAFESVDADERKNLLARGLFGAIVVEPPGATWVDPRDHEELRSGVRAVVHPGRESQLEESYREFVVFYHTPEDTQPEIRWPTKLKEQTTHAINYRCDPSGQRVNDEFPDTDKEELFYHSWTNGDPGGGDNVYTAYKGDPIKFCFVGASHEENHVHHLHQHRHKDVPQKEAPTIDAQTIGLGDTYEAYLVAGHGSGTVRPEMSFAEAFTEAGAGYTHGTAGDVLFHCHLFPHYAEGMWGFMRVLDKEHEFLEPLPQTGIVDEVDDPPTPPGTILAEDAETPGFPTFVGEAIREEECVDDPVGYGAPKPPGLTQPDPRAPTPMERAAFGDEPLPGAPYADPVDDRTRPDQQPNRLVEYTIAVMRAEIAYNDAGDHDPDGIVYVAQEVNISPGPGKSEEDVAGVTDGPVTIQDAERVRSAELNPEPLFLRANVGDCVTVKLRNELDTIDMVETRPFDASIHPHYVGYDVLASDSLPNGFNYYQGTEPSEPTDADQGNVSRWYADEEGTIYFHDHIFALAKGVHGMFCGLLVEPEGSQWRDPYSGNRVFSGAKADIVPPVDADAAPFREQALHYHDFAPLRKLDGDYVNPEMEHTVNKGTMAINYRNAPYYHRDQADPAYVHSSAVHGDPPTPVVEAYDGDPIRLRVFQGCYEEQHTFSVHGLRTEREGLPPEASVSKYLGTSEAFTFEIPGAETARDGDERTNPNGLPVRDYLYGSNVVDDLWTGMWGLVRLWGGSVNHLQSLSDAEPPGEPISMESLHEMGHPALHSDFDWTREGQRASDLYAVDDAESLLDATVYALDELGDAVLGNTDIGEDAGWRIQQHLRDLGVYDTPLVPADVDARRCSGTDAPPQPPTDAVRPCTGDDTEVREYDVTAFVTEIPYNDYGDHDPYGVVFALDRYVDEIKAGDRAPEPLFLRVNEGERLRVNLTNDLPQFLNNDHPDPEMLVPQRWERSDRVSLHPLALEYDVNAAAGVTVGFNHDTTVGPGETFTYEWTATGDIDTVCLWDMGDLRSTRHHGAFGQVLVEPSDAVPLDSGTAEPAVHGASALVRTPDGEDFREHGLLFADSQYIVNRHDPTNCVVSPETGETATSADDEGLPCTQIPEDTEDQGYGSVNYRSEPFGHRFATDDTQHLVYSSRIHGDPNTPVFDALVGDPVRFRVSCAGDKARGITFHLAGHRWERYPGFDASPAIGVDGQFGPGTSRALDLLGGAGGTGGHPGDYVFQETKQRRRLESGLWGLFRVHDNAAPESVQPLPDRADDVPLADRPGYTVEARTDVTGSGETDVIVGVPDSDLGAVNSGSVYLFVDTAPMSITHLADADLQLLAETPNWRAGQTIATADRPADSGADLRIGTATGDHVIAGGETLQEQINKASAAPRSESTLARFVHRAMPRGEWPVVPLKSVPEPE